MEMSPGGKEGDLHSWECWGGSCVSEAVSGRYRNSLPSEGQPVQRSWGGNDDLVCSGKRRHLRVGLRNGDLGKIKGGLGHAGN